MTAARPAGDLGAVVRLARRARGLTQGQLGNLLCCSASTISRLETGDQPLTNIAILQLLAQHLGIPPAVLGLSPDTTGRHAAFAVTSPPAVQAVTVDGDDHDEGGGDLVRRRELLTNLALTTGAAIAAPSLLAARGHAEAADPGARLVGRIEDALLDTTPPIGAAAAPLPALQHALAEVMADFQACRYARLADRLPPLIATAETTCRETAGDAHPAAQALLADAYNVVTRMLIKLDDGNISWISGDRARAAANASGDALVFAEATRNLCILTRSAGRHDKAQALAVDAAHRLTVGAGASDPRHLSQYGLLLSTAAYSAAKAGDRSGSVELLEEAAAAARRAPRGAHWMGFGDSGVTLYRVSSALALGDAGTAVEYARAIRPGQLPTIERQARYWVDVARAFAMWGKPQDCYRALLAAERAAPEETRSLPVVRGLAAGLLSVPRQVSLPGVRGFARRVHVAS